MSNLPPDMPEEFKKILRDLGFIDASGNFDLEKLMKNHQGIFFAGPKQDFDWHNVVNIARRICAESGSDPRPNPELIDILATASQLAENWLDQIISFPALTQAPQLWQKSDWIAGTANAWGKMIEPIAKKLSDSSNNIAAHLAPDMANEMDMLTPILGNLAGTMLTQQLSNSLGKLPAKILTACELGLPLVQPNRCIIIAENARQLAKDINQDLKDVFIYLCCLETARQRLFVSIAWLEPQITALLQHYAEGCEIDFERIREQVEKSMNPELLQEFDFGKIQQISIDFSKSFFTPKKTPEQNEILNRLETLVALIEGWTEFVASKAVEKWLPKHESLAEVLRRHRATQNQNLTEFLGLELSPRKIRDAVNLWAACVEYRGKESLAEIWAHPDLIPTAQNLEDPLGFAKGEVTNSDDLDAELAKLLAEFDED